MMSLLLSVAALLLVALGRFLVKWKNLSKNPRWRQQQILGGIKLSHRSKFLGTDRW